MHLNRVEITNIRCIEHLDWQIKESEGPGWHVFLGENGTGKTTLFRAIALALIGPTDAIALREDFKLWRSHGAEAATIKLQVNRDVEADEWAGKGRTDDTNIFVAMELNQDSNPKPLSDKATRHVWGSGKGWFSAGYGPFRRFSGGEEGIQKIFYSHPRVGRHLTIFGENVALTEVLGWLRELHFKKLDLESKGIAPAKSHTSLLERLIFLINHDVFLPHGSEISEINIDGVFFKNDQGVRSKISELSDGFRSILSMTFELIRQLVGCYGEDIFSPSGHQVVVPGVVLIDEIDVHLHPSWQKRIGFWFREHFPNIQFLVATHSILACHAAEKGSVWKLMPPGSEEPSRFLDKDELNRLLYGNILEGYGTRAFGELSTRSEKGAEFLKELSKLNQKERQAGLNDQEMLRQEALRVIFPMGAPFA